MTETETRTGDRSRRATPFRIVVAAVLLLVLGFAVALAVSRSGWSTPRMLATESRELGVGVPAPTWPGGRGATAADVRWELPPGDEVVSRVAPPAANEDFMTRTFIDAAAGELRLDPTSCPGAAVRWSLGPVEPFPGDRLLTSGAPAAELGAVTPLEGTTMLQLRLERTDGASCTAAVTWTGASLLGSEEE